MTEASSGNATAAPSMPAAPSLPNPSRRGGSNPRRGNNGRRLPGIERPHEHGLGEPSSLSVTSNPDTSVTPNGGRGGGRSRGRAPRSNGRPDQSNRTNDQGAVGDSDSLLIAETGPSNHRAPRRKPNGGPRTTPPDDGASVPEPSTQKQPAQSSRRKQFGSKLTTTDASAPSASSTTPAAKESVPSTQDLDLTSRLVAAFSRGASSEELPDCPICFSSLTAGAPTWSCSPLTSSSPEDDPIHTDHGASSCCWTTFHLKCIKAWASKSVHETGEAYANRGLTGRPGEWRCPGCQTRRSIVPNDYRCFCGRLVDPRPGRLSTPHSCGEACQRSRDNCDHPCPLQCHPGPCPPCTLSVTQQCHCGKRTITTRCSTITSARIGITPLSCGELCDRPLNCGNHTCPDTCHDGPCVQCIVQIEAKCYCGRDSRIMLCGEGLPKESRSGQDRWEGWYECDLVCDRPFDCGFHTCQKPCHPPSGIPSICPFSPSMIKTCPCSAHTPLSLLPDPPRENCRTPVPTCGRVCDKRLDGCSHSCPKPCHNGPCPPCLLKVDEICRCGQSSRSDVCWKITQAQKAVLQGLNDDSSPRDEQTGSFLCKKKCPAMKNCGRHNCGRLCCPLSALAGLVDTGKKKKKARDLPNAAELAELDPEGWHTCIIICGRLLPCGNHTCMEQDHKGSCPTCLQSSYEEMSCHCGRTILEPPIPCGTRIQCSYPCARPLFACGHPKASHTCHDNSDPCPPCPFLADKICACEKNTLQNVRCSQKEVHCGVKCGKLLDCGFHSCEQLCHSGACGTCNQLCGKLRKLCLPAQHPCTQPCHAPSVCPETEPCTARISLQCACGRQKQPANCGISSSNSVQPNRVLPCMQECQVAKRNERLAAALGITPREDGRASAVGSTDVKYSETVIQFWRANPTFAAGVEKTLNDFLASDKRLIVLSPMPPPKRKFVRDLAEVYRLDGEDVDQEPRRSVQLRRRLDSRVPKNLLSATVDPPAPGSRTSTPKPSSTASSSSAPKPAWGQQRPAFMNGGASSTPRDMPWSSLLANDTARGSGSSHTPPLNRVATPPSIPVISNPLRSLNPPVITGDVPSSWDETVDD